ncbi:MAG: M15 family metallopeptidase [Candidatus Berkiella sp.]
MAILKRLSIYTIISLLVILWCMGCTKTPKESLPKGFVYLTDIDPTMVECARYATPENFLGRVVPGYSTHKIVCTREAALALKAVHADLNQQGYTLVVYDAYRPQRSVDAFVKWADDLNDLTAKKLYYPTIDKKDLFRLDYIAGKSSHTRGSTFDLGIIKTGDKLKAPLLTRRKLSNGEEVPFLDDNTVDMGSSFDLFHPVSNHDSSLVTEQQTKMRNVLRETMKNHGFKEYQQEWWHYTLANEPYPNIYFDFVVG